MATLAEIRRENRVDGAGVERMARALFAAKAKQYRETLLHMLHVYGRENRARVVLAAELRESLRKEALDHARIIARGHNEFMDRQIDKLRAKGYSNDLIAKALPHLMSERVRGRAQAIARHEATLAHLDAQVQFFRENGVEPLFDLVGPRANSCPLCTAIFRGNPWPIEAVLKIGYPHMNCRHGWRARGVTARDLLRGGARPNKISTGRTSTVGIGSEEPFGHRFPSSEAAVNALRDLFSAENDGETFEAVATPLHPGSILPRDGDGDGMVYDGTPMERPALPLSDLPDGTWVKFEGYGPGHRNGRILHKQDQYQTDSTFYVIEEFPLGAKLEVIDRNIVRLLTKSEVKAAERKYIFDPEQEQAVADYANPHRYDQIQAAARGALPGQGPAPEYYDTRWHDTIEKLEETIRAKGFSREGEVVFRRTAEQFIPPVGQEVAIHGFFSTTADQTVALDIGGVTQGADAPMLVLTVETNRPAIDLHDQWGQGPHEYLYGQNTRIVIDRVETNSHGLKFYIGRIVG